MPAHYGRGLHLQMASVHNGGATCSAGGKVMELGIHFCLLHLCTAIHQLMNNNTIPAPMAGVHVCLLCAWALLAFLRATFRSCAVISTWHSLKGEISQAGGYT